MSLRLFVASVAATAFLAFAFVATTSAPTSTPAYALTTKCLPGIIKKRMAQIRKKFGKIRVVSTFRRGARIRGTGRPSYHASCRALDFKPPRGKYRAVARWLKANHGGGVGTYSCKMHHIHIDNGPRVRFHKCIK
ncbi:MAG: D-Ala-D-Ala carboxypeptidase family metallohydrolase [Pseudomonadota bacterium]